MRGLLRSVSSSLPSFTLEAPVPKIDPAIKKAFGIKTDDPHAAVQAIFRKASKPIRKAHNRAVIRSRLVRVTVDDADPDTPGQQHGSIRLKASASDSPGELAAKVGTLIARGHGDLFIDEGRRILVGMQRGPKKPKRLEGDDHGGGIERVSDSTMAILYPSLDTRRMYPRGLFGIDDAIIFGLAVPLLVVLIPIVLPMIIEWGAKAFDMVEGPAPGDAHEGDPGAESNEDDPLDAAKDALDEVADTIGLGSPGQDDSMITLALLAGVVVLAIVVVRKKG